ncbi:MAG: peptidylprolyl isomerase [Betaproteobacteria bacterium]
MHKPTLLTLAFAMTLTLAAPAAMAQVAKVNGVTIPQARADALVREATAQGRPDNPELRTLVKQRLIESEILAQEAVKLGLNKNPEVSTQLDLVRQTVLSRAYVNDVAKRNPPTEDALRKAYEQNKDQPGASEYKARHILVATEAEAKMLITQLNGGADFAKLAVEKSRDEGSKPQGGELNWSPANSYVRPFAEAMIKLQKGAMTAAPVQSQFGWHIIRLDDKRPLSYEALKPQLQQLVQQETVQKTIDDLRAKAKVE